MRLFILLLLLLIGPFSPQEATAQTLNLPANPCSDNIVVHLEALATLPGYSLTTPFSGQWSLRTGGGTGCASTFGGNLANGHVENLGGNLRATFLTSGTSQIVLSNTGGTLVEGARTLTARLTAGPDTYIYHLRFIVRKPTDLLFVLDRSGSMECDTDEDSVAGWPGCSTGDTGAAPDDRRWNLLRSALSHFMNKLDPAHTLSGDRLGVVYFDGNASTTGGLTSGAMPFRPVDDFRGTGGATPFLDELQNMNAGGNDLGRNGTSLGAGLVEAVSIRFGGNADPNRREVVLLFSDGEQNRGNWVRSSGVGVGSVIQQSEGNATEVLNLDAPAVSPLEVMTVGMVTSGNGADLMEDIAKEPGNYFNVIPGDEDRFGSDLAGDAFNEIYNQFSPRYVGREFMPLTGRPRATFTVNRRVNRLIFEAFYDRAVSRAVKVKIFRNGADVTRHGRRHETDHGLTYVFPLYADTLSSAGQWTMELLPGNGAVTPGTEVAISATADDHHVRFEAGTVETDLVVGRTFRPQLTLSELGSPVTGATVTAAITRAGDDLGDLLARTEVSQLPATHSETANCAERKYGALRQNRPAVLQALFRHRSNTVTLTDRGGGRYEGNFTGADVTGVYKIVYRIAYTSPELGEVRRMVEQTRYVGFPPPELDLSYQSLKGELTRGDLTVVTARPRYRTNGKYRFVGPGYATAFGTTNPAVRVAANDRCDGSYTLSVSGPPGERFDLYLGKQVVYEGTVSDFNSGATKPPKYYLSLSGGRTLPQGDFDRRFDPGVYGEIGLGRRFGSLLGLELTGGYYGFEPDYSILGGTAYLNLYFGGGGGTSLLVGAGPGYYVPEGEDGRLGGSARAALERRFGKLSLGVEGGYFRLTEPELDFATLGLRATIGF